MDQGIATIVAAAMSTLVGGLVGFLSSYFTSRQVYRHTVTQFILPKQVETSELVANVLFRSLSGERVSEDEWDRYISACFWLPNDLRVACLSLLSNKTDREKIAQAQQMVIAYCDSLIKGR